MVFFNELFQTVRLSKWYSAGIIVMQYSIALHEGQNLQLSDSNWNIPYEGKNAENIIPS